MGDLMKSRTAKKIIALAMIASGALISLGGVGYAQINHRISNPAPAPIPGEVASLSLTRVATGWQAVREVSRLHGKDFPLTSAGVGGYGADESITIWATGAPVRPLAWRMLVAMRDKIAENNSPFTPLGERRDRRRAVYELEGLGQKHFYFQSGNLIVWLAVDEELAEQALAQILEYYP